MATARGEQIRRTCIAVLTFIFFSSGSAGAKTPAVLASIAPVHSLVAAVMDGVGEPELLVPATASDHDYALKPSDVRKIAGSDLVVWVGEALETYLVKPVGTEGVADLELLGLPGVDPHPFRPSEANPEPAEAAPAEREESRLDKHGAAGAEAQGPPHAHTGLDPHVWLDPVRAKAIVLVVAERLAEIDSRNAALYRRNASAAAAQLDRLDAEIRSRLAALSGKPFVTFHDGYSYFVERYGLEQVGHLTLNPDQQAGAATVRALQEVVRRAGVACVFTEPQFDSEVIETMTGADGVKVAELDAIGAGLQPGPELYTELMRKNTAAIEQCLSSTS